MSETFYPVSVKEGNTLKYVNLSTDRGETFEKSLSGKITGCKRVEQSNDNGSWETYHLTLVKGSEEFVLGLSESYFKNFLRFVPNFDIEKAIRINIGVSEYNGKISSSLWVNIDTDNKDESKIQMSYTSKNPDGKPEAGKKTVKGKEVLDFEEIDNFMWQKGEDFINSFGTMSPEEVDAMMNEKKEVPKAAPTKEIGPEDLPF